MRFNVKAYQAKLAAVGIEWRPPTLKEIRCKHEWDRPLKSGETRKCTKCGGTQTN